MRKMPAEGRHATGRNVWVRLSLPASAPNTPVFLIGAVFGMLLVLIPAKRP